MKTIFTVFVLLMTLAPQVRAEDEDYILVNPSAITFDKVYNRRTGYYAIKAHINDSAIGMVKDLYLSESGFTLAEAFEFSGRCQVVAARAASLGRRFVINRKRLRKKWACTFEGAKDHAGVLVVDPANVKFTFDNYYYANVSVNDPSNPVATGGYVLSSNDYTVSMNIANECEQVRRTAASSGHKVALDFDGHWGDIGICSVASEKIGSQGVVQ